MSAMSPAKVTGAPTQKNMNNCTAGRCSCPSSLSGRRIVKGNGKLDPIAHTMGTMNTDSESISLGLWQNHKAPPTTSGSAAAASTA